MRIIYTQTTEISEAELLDAFTETEIDALENGDSDVTNEVESWVRDMASLGCDYEEITYV